MVSCSLAAAFLDNLTGVSLRQPPVAMIAALLAGMLVSPAIRPRDPLTGTVTMWRGKGIAFLPLLPWVLAMAFYLPGALDRIESDTHLHNGKLATSAGRNSIAVQEFRKASGAAPGNLVASFDLTISLLREKRSAEALEVIRSLKASAPDYPKSSLLESLALMELDSLQAAHRAIRDELMRRDHPEAYFTEALILSRMRDTSAVRTALESVLVRNVAGSIQVHLEPACRTLLTLADRPEHFVRLRGLLEQVVGRFPASPVYSGILDQANEKAGMGRKD
jgi:hypothetical protein